MAADPRFFPAQGPLRLSAITAAADAECDADGARLFRGVAPLSAAGPDDVSYLEGRRHAAALGATRAGAVLVSPDALAEVPQGSIALVCAAPQLAFARVAALFHPRPSPTPGIHPTACIATDARIGDGCEVGPFAVIGAGAQIGSGCILGPHVTIGPGCVLGAGSVLRSHASMLHCIAGERVVLNEGVRVGNEGFGFVTTRAGEHVTVPQVGRVILGDGVEIGANSCVDRGAGGDTVLGPGTRLDNLVQIGHNVKTGRGCIIVAQVGIAGSAQLGDFVVVAGQAGINGHIELGNGARVGAQAGVTSSVPAGSDVIGSPAWPAREFIRAMARLRQMAAPKGNGKSDETS